MADTHAGGHSSIVRLILVPGLITLAVTMLRLGGELARLNKILFNPAPGGPWAIVGIPWLAPIFGVYFAVKLARGGGGPASLARGAALAVAFLPTPDLLGEADRPGLTAGEPGSGASDCAKGSSSAACSFSATRCATRGSSRAGSSTVNSSPARRASTSEARSADRMRCATLTSSASPARWPSESLTALK